ncbi:hypothetical protein OTK59_22645, partial [Vibrio natriegens]|nr:hypothetical protein [Vibrio natriegens]
MMELFRRVMSRYLPCFFIVLTSFCTSGLVSAQDINQLQRNHDVEIKAWVGKATSNEENRNSPNFSVNEQVILTIEVATPRWFTGGTRIGSVEIPDVIAKQRNQLA